MATARKLPSGSWRIRVYDYTDESGKAHYRSFTSKDPTLKGKRKCEADAAAWAIEKETHANESITFGQGIDQYIASRENVLSPRTIMDYKRTRRLYVQSLMSLLLMLFRRRIFKKLSILILCDYLQKRLETFTA